MGLFGLSGLPPHTHARTHARARDRGGNRPAIRGAKAKEAHHVRHMPPRAFYLGTRQQLVVGISLPSLSMKVTWLYGFSVYTLGPY